MNFTLGLGLTETLDAGPQATPSPGREPTADAEADFSAILSGKLHVETEKPRESAKLSGFDDTTLNTIRSIKADQLSIASTALNDPLAADLLSDLSTIISNLESSDTDNSALSKTLNSTFLEAGAAVDASASEQDLITKSELIAVTGATELTQLQLLDNKAAQLALNGAANGNNMPPSGNIVSSSGKTLPVGLRRDLLTQTLNLQDTRPVTIKEISADPLQKAMPASVIANPQTVSQTLKQMLSVSERADTQGQSGLTLASRSTEPEVLAKSESILAIDGFQNTAANKAGLFSQILDTSPQGPILLADSPPTASKQQINAATSAAANNDLAGLNAPVRSDAARLPSGTGLESSSSFVIDSPAGSTNWSNQVGDRVRWMSNVKLSSAELKLHPTELGAMEIKIITEENQTKVSFITSNAAAKELIESAMPRLRELLNNSGLQLEQSDVSHKDLSDKQSGQEQRRSGDIPNRDFGVLTEDQSLPIRRISSSQVDHYV